ncbi:MAG: hypothetical protein ACW99A_20765, partial [Candidatus Kariarchaeaceae archaeon]
LCKNKDGNVMGTSDIGLLNVKYWFSNHIRKCMYKNDHGTHISRKRIRHPPIKRMVRIVTHHCQFIPS